MSFIIEKVEIMPYKCQRNCNLNFKPVPEHMVPMIVPAIVVKTLNKFENMENIEIEYQDCTYKYCRYRSILHSKVSKKDGDIYEFYKCQGLIKNIHSFIGKELNIENIKDIPCVEFSDPSTELPAYTIEKNIIKLFSRIRTGRMFGAPTYKTQLLANIYITGSNGKKIIDYCNRCGFKYE